MAEAKAEGVSVAEPAATWLVEQLREHSMSKHREAWGRNDGGQDLLISSTIADEAADLIERQAALIEEMRAALQECTDDLDMLLEHHHLNTKSYPQGKLRYERDMAPVKRARAVLSKVRKG